MATLKKQKGSTVMGFIAGLIIGLIIAVVVALMVTKAPIPFAGLKDKADNTSSHTTTPATTPSADPNQSLYGKETVKPVLPAQTDNTNMANTTPAQPASTAISTPVIPNNTPEQVISDDKTLYYLQAGAFRNKNEAENMRGNLALLGFESHISEGTSNSGKIYRVRLGPYNDNMTKSIQNKLKQNGIGTTITRLTK